MNLMFFLSFAYIGCYQYSPDACPTAGFLPVISMEGAIVQHCEVATSNNGWVIEVVNPTTNSTLWLDPTNPTGLLRWGSVLCQAVVDERGYEI